MTSKPSVLFLIVARGGSKGLPRKNLKRIHGLSLVGYKARAALAFDPDARLVISTDSAEIQDEARLHSVDVFFTRPAGLATDTATSAEVVLDAMERVERRDGHPYDAIMLLEPSSPFATPEHFRRAIEIFAEQNADLVVGMREPRTPTVFVGEQTPNDSIAGIVKNMRKASGLRRQDQKAEWTMNGSLYLFRWSAFKGTREIYGAPEKCFGLLMDRFHSVEIEAAEDLALATFYVENGYIDMSPWGLETPARKDAT